MPRLPGLPLPSARRSKICTLPGEVRAPGSLQGWSAGHPIEMAEVRQCQRKWFVGGSTTANCCPNNGIRYEFRAAVIPCPIHSIVPKLPHQPRKNGKSLIRGIDAQTPRCRRHVVRMIRSCFTVVGIRPDLLANPAQRLEVRVARITWPH